MTNIQNGAVIGADKQREDEERKAEARERWVMSCAQDIVDDMAEDGRSPGCHMAAQEDFDPIYRLGVILTLHRWGKHIEAAEVAEMCWEQYAKEEAERLYDRRR